MTTGTQSGYDMTLSTQASRDSAPDSGDPFSFLRGLSSCHGVSYPPAVIGLVRRDLGRWLPHDLHAVETLCIPHLFDQHATDGEAIAEMFLSWERAPGRSPSLAALAMVAARRFDFVDRPDLLNPLLMAAVLGEIENTQFYHNNVHYRKVLFHAIRMADAHNRVYAGSPDILDAESLALLFTAACVHDLAHDGRGNTIDGRYYPGRLEKISCRKAEPYLLFAGMSPDSFRKLEISVLLTEVTPLGDSGHVAPVRQLKQAYCSHFSDEKKAASPVQLSKSFESLETDRMLTLSAMILHESDIATSAGLTPRMTMHESRLVKMESHVCDDADSGFIRFFLETICNHAMLTRAGQTLYSENMDKITHQARTDWMTYYLHLDRNTSRLALPAPQGRNRDHLFSM